MTRAQFEDLVERHRAELRVHCYRMLGSLDESEDLLQETFLRAWRGRAGFVAGSARAWLYRIATNACLDVLRARPRRILVAPGPASESDAEILPAADLPWLQPYPDSLLTELVARETIELVFLAAIQYLPPRQRAVLLFRDVLEWSAKDVASQLDSTVASVNSALQRARSTLREQLPERREDWAATTDEHADLLRRYVDAHEQADVEGFAALLHEDARLTMPPHPMWFDGRAAIAAASARGFDPAFGSLRSVVTAANRQPAAAHYLRPPEADGYRPLALDVLRVEHGRIVEIVSFVDPALFKTFGLPDEFSARPR
jgi:RNA polymerase sigma-70 factor (ECF subfamily)